MNITKEDIIVPIFEDNIKGIAIDPILAKDQIGKIEKINYPNFKWIGKMTIKSEYGEEKEVHFIEIVNLPDNLIKEVTTTIKNLINDDNLSVAESLNEIINYFKKVIFSKQATKELIGDLGEAVLILKCFEQGIDIAKYLRSYDEGLYDFNINNWCVEVKTTSPEKNEFKITHEQLKQIEQKMIIVCKFKILQQKTNILDLYEMISKYCTLNNLLIQKQIRWKYYLEQYDVSFRNDILDDYSIDLDKTKLFCFRNENLPIIDIIDKKSCKKITYSINCTDSELTPIDILYDKLRQKS